MHFPGVRKHERAKWAYRRCKAPRWWLMGVGAGGWRGENGRSGSPLSSEPREPRGSGSLCGVCTSLPSMKQMVTSNPEWGPGTADVGSFSSSQRMKPKTDDRYHFSRIPPLPPKP